MNEKPVLRPGRLVLLLDVAAVAAGAFLPFFVRGRFDPSIISFPHLVERFELITIITFGEGVVGMTGFFDVGSLSLRPVLVFAVILSLFGCYVTQIHYLCNHHQVARSLRLMFSHYLVVIAVNLVTVALMFLGNPEADRLFTAELMVAALALFLAAILSDHIYYHDAYRLGPGDAAASCAFLLAGAAVMLLVQSTIYGFLVGALVATCGNFAMLLKKYRSHDMP